VRSTVTLRVGLTDAQKKLLTEFATSPSLYPTRHARHRNAPLRERSPLKMRTIGGMFFETLWLIEHRAPAPAQALVQPIADPLSLDIELANTV
jgi:hypothetical protein